MSDTLFHRRLNQYATRVLLVTFLVVAGTGSRAEVSAAGQYAVRPLVQVERHGYVAVTANQMAREDAQRAAAGLPYRFALPVDVALTTDNAGTWEILPDGRSLWRLRLGSPGVLSLNLGFVRFELPEGARLMVYPADSPTAARRFDTEVNAGHGQLWTHVFLTDELVVELVVRQGERALVDLELGAIGRGYRFFGEDLTGKSGACNVDVICPAGDPWRDEIDTVGVVQRDGQTLCTGFMINNTAADGRPLFMTAFHCFVDVDSAPTLVVYWNFQSPTCGQHGGGVKVQTSSGSTLLAGFASSDFTLVELDQAPSPAYGVKFAGWDRSSADPDTAVCIHHPSTDEKSISFEYDTLSTTTYLINGPPPGDGTHLRVADWDLGTTEGGSSGSPLFDANHRVVGQLHGGGAACGNNLSDWYGRFSVSWAGGGTPTTSLRDHLDAAATGAMAVDLFDPQAASFVVTPVGDGAATGVAGGPFAPTNHEFTVVNNGSEAVSFTVDTTTNWLTLDTAGATLGIGQQMTVTASLTPAAAALSRGIHHGVISFGNPVGGSGATTHEVVLTIAGNAISLVGPVPNPFTTPPVEIRYELRGDATVSARITNIRGLKIRDLGRFAGTSGLNAILWDGLDDHGHHVPSGVYVVAIEGVGQTMRTNLVYVR